jgi:hypothetical protein
MDPLRTRRRVLGHPSATGGGPVQSGSGGVALGEFLEAARMPNQLSRSRIRATARPDPRSKRVTERATAYSRVGTHGVPDNMRQDRAAAVAAPYSTAAQPHFD